MFFFNQGLLKTRKWKTLDHNFFGMANKTLSAKSSAHDSRSPLSPHFSKIYSWGGVADQLLIILEHSPQALG